ncbi:hypothetical protein RCO48_21905 [Peribacillus frigoritolerans]|nr:hypothetical protein [Peribacillus frigoritolerans]
MTNDKEKWHGNREQIMLLMKQQLNQLMMVIIIIQDPWKKAIAEIQEEQYSLPGKKILMFLRTKTHSITPVM